jgi:hypothetical protein
MVFVMWPFAKNASFKSSDVICWSLPPSSLPGELSMEKRDSNGFFQLEEYVWLGQIHQDDWFTTHRSTLPDKLLGYLCML